MNNQSNTAQGENVEHLLQNSLPVFNEGVFAAVCASCGLDHRLHNGNDLVGARGKRKTDVEFFFEGGAALRLVANPTREAATTTWSAANCPLSASETV